MATKLIIADQAWRALQAQGIDRKLEDVENDITPALLDISREAMYGPHRTELETTLSLTLGAADSNGIQTATVSATIFEESVMLCDDVNLVGVKLEYKPSVAHLYRLLSTSTVPCYTVVGTTLSARRPSSALATSASALKVRGVLKLTDVANVPASMDAILIQRLVGMGGGAVAATEPKAA